MQTGDVNAEGGDFFGRTVVMAARVAGAAGGGEIMVSKLVQEGLVGAFGLGVSRSHSLKGLTGHHAVYPVFWS